MMNAKMTSKTPSTAPRGGGYHSICYSTILCTKNFRVFPEPVSGERLFVTSMFSVFIPRYTVIQAHSGDAGAPPHAHAVVFF